MGPQWHYLQDGKQHGPITEADLKQLVAAGKVKPTDLVWKQGMPQWVAVSSVAGMLPPTSPVAAVPPPPPVKPVASTPTTPPQAVKAVPASVAPVGNPTATSPTQVAKPGVVENLKQRLQSEETKALIQKAKAKWQGASTPVKAGIIGGVAVGGFLILGLCCVLPLSWFFGGSGKLPLKDGGGTTQAAPADRNSTDAGTYEIKDLLQSFLDNRQAAEKKHLRKTITARGVVIDIMNEFHGVPNNNDGNVVRLETGSVRGEVTCTFSMKHARRLMELGKGKEIVFTGKCTKYRTGKWREGEAGFLELEDCELLEASGGKKSGNATKADEMLKRIAVGMSKREVTNILGQPDGRNPVGQGEACLYYVSAEEAIFITFDKQGRVFTAHKQDRAK